MYGIQILVFPSLGVDAATVISPTHSQPFAIVQLGHYAENHGEHYICVEGLILAIEKNEQHLLSDNENNADVPEIQREMIIDEPRDTM